MDGIEFNREALADIEGSLQREWLETNGLGGFASSTILGVNTRRYHGLLTAAMKVLVSKLEETIILGGKHYDLGANRYPGVLYPRGFEYLTRFRLDPFPVFTYRAGDVEIDKRVFLVQNENTVVVEYEMREGPECLLELRPLIAFRDYHGLTHRNDALNPEYVLDGNTIQLTPYSGLPTLYIAHSGADVERSGDWYYSFEYDRERERGLDFQEDLFNPFVARFTLRAGGTATFIASTEPTPKVCPRCKPL